MLNKVLYWFTAVCAGLAFLLVVSNLCMINGNYKIQQEISFRQNVINTAVSVSPINQQLAQALYDAAIKSNDKQIKTLLTEQGFTIEEKPAKAAEAPKAEAAKAPAKPAPAKAKKEGEE